MYQLLNYNLLGNPEAIAAVCKIQPRRLPPRFPQGVRGWKDDEPPVPNEADLWKVTITYCILATKKMEEMRRSH